MKQDRCNHFLTINTEKKLAQCYFIVLIQELINDILHYYKTKNTHILAESKKPKFLLSCVFIFVPKVVSERKNVIVIHY